MAKKQSKTAKKAAKAKSTGGATGVRKRVHELTLRAVRDHDLSLRDLPGLAGEVVQGVASGLNKAVPQSSRNVLRQVVDGLTDAVAATAKAARATASSAAERGTEFIKKDVAKTADDLVELEDRFISSLRKAGRSLKGAAKDEMDTIVSEAKKAGTKIRPAAERAVSAADGRVMELGRETVDAGARLTRGALGTLLHGAGGLLEGLADAVGKPAPSKASTTKKKTAKKTKKKSAKR